MIDRTKNFLSTDEEAKLLKQSERWQAAYLAEPELFGAGPSEAASQAARFFSADEAASVLELGSGYGRDSIYLAERGFKVYALDYSRQALENLRSKIQGNPLESNIEVIFHDLHEPLPFETGAVDAVYGHMIFCMALSMRQLKGIAREVRRVLRPGGDFLFTVRHTGDPHFGEGIHHGENLYEVNGFIVHFFSQEMVEELAEGFDIVDVQPFEEGSLPRKLWMISLRKPDKNPA